MIRSSTILLYALSLVVVDGSVGTAKADSGRTITSNDVVRIMVNCQAIYTTADLPERLKTAFTGITKQREFGLANPGDPYQATDVIEDPKLPVRRLIFAGKCGDFWFIHYEQGGRGHSFAVVFFGENPRGDLSFVWGGRGFSRASSSSDLRNEIARKTFSDDLPFYW